MKIVFEKFAKAGGMYYAMDTEGRVTKHTSMSIEVLDGGKPTGLFPDSVELVSREDWVKECLPTSFVLGFDDEVLADTASPKTPGPRQLTTEEQVLDVQWRNLLAGAKQIRAGRIREAIFAAAENRAAFEITRTETTEYSSMPLLAALAEVVAPIPDPEDPIAWRRTSTKFDSMKVYLPLVIQLINTATEVLGGKVKVSAAVKRASPQEPSAAPPANAQRPPDPEPKKDEVPV